MDFSKLKYFFLLLIFTSTCLNLAGCVTENQYTEIHLKKGKYYFNLKQYRRAFENLLPIAQAGNADAQYAVGYMYFYGQGIVENKQAAIYWMQKAAAQNQPNAILALKKLNSYSAVKS